MFSKVLIANRGEIAVRIAHTLQEMGIGAAAVYAGPDRRALHVRCADEAYPLAGVAPAETYLCAEKIIDAALRHGADAIHPGYGFLSENGAFAESCARAGITFIGPCPQVIRAMGDKVVAKQTMIDAGVPVVPGWSPPAPTHGEPDPRGPGPDPSEILAAAQTLGYPVLIKAAAGGGGKGMRVVTDAHALPPALEAARREANAAFGDPRVFLEKYIPRPRHVEFQIFGDAHGHHVHLFERECSIQRRHQKIVEESPSPAMTPELRRRMGEAAVRAARAVGYTNAGTVEFMLDTNGDFYFLEVNTRLQVEHPVTEMIVGQDLVRAQIIVAAGEPLPFSQQDVRQTGHALECRIYAEDPAAGFLPSIGTIEHYAAPQGPNVRVDSGVERGSHVTVHFDPMLAKLITWGPTRAESLARMVRALRQFVILGVTTNLDFLQRLITHPDFQAGNVHTHFIDEHDLLSDHESPVPAEALIAAALASRNMRAPMRDEHARPVKHAGPWHALGHWRAF